MVDVVELLLQHLPFPIVLSLLLTGAVPALIGLWLRGVWRSWQDTQLRALPGQRALLRRYRRDPKMVKVLTTRLRSEVGLDLGRWLVASLLWAGVLVGWAALSVGLLQRAWVRDQLDRDLDKVPAALAGIVFLGWLSAIVWSARISLDRRHRYGRPSAPGVWPALTRALPIVFVLVGIAAWLANREGYPIQVALIATVLPGTGLLVLTILQDLRQPVSPFQQPAWLVGLAPSLGEDRSAIATPVSPVHTSMYAVAERALELRGRPAGLPFASTGRPGPLSTASPAGVRWSDLANDPEPLTSRDPRRLGQYAVHDRIGSGGMAVVFRATNRSGQQVAVKIPAQVHAVDAMEQRRLAAEITTMGQLDVPGVVRIREAARDDGLLFIAMDYLHGPTLDLAVRRAGPFTDQALIRALAARTARALAGIHRAGITHRDVKPKNVILTDSGPVLVDLGIAKVADATGQLTATGTIVGSPGYVPPELHRGAPVDHRADIWAWGCCMVLAASGEPLFDGDGARGILTAVLNNRPSSGALAALVRVDAELAKVVSLAVHPDPRKRPTDGADLVRRLPPAGAWPLPTISRRGHSTDGRLDFGSPATTRS